MRKQQDVRKILYNHPRWNGMLQRMVVDAYQKYFFPFLLEIGARFRDGAGESLKQMFERGQVQFDLILPPNCEKAKAGVSHASFCLSISGIYYKESALWAEVDASWVEEGQTQFGLIEEFFIPPMARIDDVLLASKTLRAIYSMFQLEKIEPLGQNELVPSMDGFGE